MKIVLSLLIVALLAACGNNAGKQAPAKDTSAIAVPPPAETTTVQLKDDALNAVYEHYARLTTALVNGDAAASRLAANAIQVGAAGITGGEPVKAAAVQLMETPDIAAQRRAYATLSNAIIALAKQSGMSAGSLYVDFCPMAMDDKGAYWLSTSKDIQNPYFGEEMKTCGEVKETIQ